MILGFQHHKPGKGGAFVRTRLKNVRLGTVIDRTFRAGETLEDVYVEEKKYQYLYHDDRYHFMENETYEQISLSGAEMGEAKKFIKENTYITALTHKDRILNIKLPTFVNLKIVETEPGLRGDTVKAGTKNAKLETGAVVQVPLFINSGEIVTIDTRTAKYVGRA